MPQPTKRPVRKTAAPKPVDIPQKIQFETLLKEVSASVIAAQQQLDLASLAYARQLEGSPLQPVYYTIPNVKAEVKLGFLMDENDNIFVKLFGDPKDKSTYGESTISFEVVACPPPPGATPTEEAPKRPAPAPDRR